MDGSILPAGPRVTEPGAYDGIPAGAYHGNCTPEPSLSSSGARVLTDECPALYWHSSPMNPAYVREEKRHFDIGTAGHLMVLEPDAFDARTAVIDADSYRSKDAQAQRDAAYAAGKTPLLLSEVGMIHEMRKALDRHPVARHAFSGGIAERSYFWRDPEYGVWLKCRPDYTPPSMRYLPDYKTGISANPKTFARRVWDYGYHRQAAWYMDGIEAITGEKPGRFFFIVQSKEAPYAVSPCELDSETIEWGRIQNRKAIEIFARCLDRGTAAEHWPGYSDPASGLSSFVVTLPKYATRELEERHEAGEFETHSLTKAA